MPSPHVLFSWHQVDETLANMMLAQVSQEIRVLIHEDEQQIHFQNIGNGNSVTAPSQRLETQRLRSDEWAGRIYELYCETWQCQQKPLSPQFLRGLCQHGIRVLISARVDSVTSELDREQERTRKHDREWLKSVKTSFSRKWNCSSINGSKLRRSMQRPWNICWLLHPTTQQSIGYNRTYLCHDAGENF
jgi:hypothetical protein